MGQDPRTRDHTTLWLPLGYSSWILALWGPASDTWIFSPFGACPFDFSVLGFHSLWNSWILGPTGTPPPRCSPEPALRVWKSGTSLAWTSSPRTSGWDSNGRPAVSASSATCRPIVFIVDHAGWFCPCPRQPTHQELGQGGDTLEGHQLSTGLCGVESFGAPALPGCFPSFTAPLPPTANHRGRFGPARGVRPPPPARPPKS